MHNFFKIILFFSISIFLLLSCPGKKKKSDNSQNMEESSTSEISNVTQYVNNESILIYSSPEDVGKNYNEVTGKYFVMNFGQSVTVIKEKKMEITEYSKGEAKKVEAQCYNIQLPDNTMWWGKKDYFSSKFIVINKDSVNCYSQPDQSYKTNIILDKGDFGKFVKESNNGYVNVDFFAYSKDNNGIKKNWVGNKWIQSDDYTDNIDMAKESYFLYLARYFNIVGNDKTAIKYLEKSLDVSSGQDTDITPVVRQFLDELKGNTNDMSSETTE